MQETCRYVYNKKLTLQKKIENQWKNEWYTKLIFCHGSSNSRGVAILIKNGVECTIHQKVLHPLGRYIILKAEINDKMYMLINVYAPNKDKDIVAFFNNLLITIQKEALDSENKIVFNLVEISIALLTLLSIRKVVIPFKENQSHRALTMCKENTILSRHGGLKTQTPKALHEVKIPLGSFAVRITGSCQIV